MPRSQKITPAKDTRQRARTIVRRLAREYPDAACALHYRNPLELLVATILSAQCTDARVNIVTRTLFDKYRSAADYAAAEQTDLENDIRSTGFYRNKAKNIRACCQGLAEKHGGQVPDRMEDLVDLPGIGRKTANVILGTAMGLATGVVVDTHVYRLARRMGLTRQGVPEKIERDLMQLVPQAEWIDFGHRMIHHGRRVCAARKPNCATCCLNDICPKVSVPKKRSNDPQGGRAVTK